MKKVFAVLCGCVMIILTACGGKNSTNNETKGATPTATVTTVAQEITEPAEPTATVTAEPTAVPTEEPEITNTIALPTPTTVVAPTAVPTPIMNNDAVSAKEFLEFFKALGKEHSVSRVNELKNRFDGRTILEDNTIYVVYLDLTTLPENGFEPCDAWDGWYRWNGDDEEYSFFKGIFFTDEEYEAGVLEIEVRESAAYGTTPGSDSKERSGYWLYFRNDGYVDTYNYTICREGLGEEVDPTGAITNADLYYREITDRTDDLVFELASTVPASEDGKTYRISKHVSVLSTVKEVRDVEYYVDTVVKECDNAEDGSKSTVSADFEIVDLYRPGTREPVINLAKGSLAVGEKKTIDGTSESEIEKAAKELVESTVALSGYTFDVRKTDGAYLVHFGDGIDVVEVVATIGYAEENGGTTLTIDKLELGYSIFD